MFKFAKVTSHRLTANNGDNVRFPHSRWNEVRASELAACGYRVLTQSVDGGVDSFIKKRKRSLFVHFQGHPEYGAQTLFKEFRRDVKRFLKRERETYPAPPKGYFDNAATKLMNEFRDTAVADRREEVMESFPESVAGGLEKIWHASAVSVYRNWLQYIISRKGSISVFPAIATVYHSSPRKRSAAR